MSDSSGTIRLEEVPNDSIIIDLTPKGEFIRYYCKCGSGGAVSMYDGNAEDLYIMARRHNIMEHRDTFSMRDRT